jgi:uncharacterized membrane protein
MEPIPDEDVASPEPVPGRRAPAGSRPIGLGLVLLCLFGTLALGAALKAPCGSAAWTDGRQYRWLCYSDILPLLGTEQLTSGRLPFIDRCDPALSANANCDEYPVLTMYFMRVSAWISGPSYSSFFAVNAVLLAACAVAIALCLYLIAGARTLLFALAPTLLIYGFMNWDLFAVALATGAFLAFVNRRDRLAGVLAGLGVAAKLYPALLLVAFILERRRTKEPDRVITLAWSSVLTWLVVNVPFAIASPSSWWTFFRFNSARPADFDSLWYVGCNQAHVSLVCGHVGRINLLSAALFVTLCVLIAWAKGRRHPDYPRWELAFPIVVLFLLTNKVYSPQYGLWLLPLFAIALPDVRAFVAFELADIAVFLTRFWWFGKLSGFWGTPFWMFETAIVLRTAVLVWCLVSWIMRAPEALPGAIGFERPRPTRPAQVPA